MQAHHLMDLLWDLAIYTLKHGGDGWLTKHVRYHTIKAQHIGPNCMEWQCEKVEHLYHRAPNYGFTYHSSKCNVIKNLSSSLAVLGWVPKKIRHM